MTLNERKYMILQAIIDDYISTAVPVGSRTISRKSGVGYSPATIRNEMSDLEELGYLAQPHTSAGRVPSVKAYRLYVDELMRQPQLPESEREAMHESIAKRTEKMENIIRDAAQVLADETGYTAVIMAPKLSTMRIRHIQLVPVSTGRALMIIVTGVGIVKDTMISVPEDLNADDLYAISRMMTQRLEDKPLDQVRQTFAEMLRDTDINRRLLGAALSVIESKLEAGDTDDFYLGGGTNLLRYPEYSDVQKARSFLKVLESRETLKMLLKRDGGSEVSIRIGPENGVPELADCTVVTARYHPDDGIDGTIGIIGPIRMNYNRVISVMEFMSRALTEVLSDRR